MSIPKCPDGRLSPRAVQAPGRADADQLAQEQPEVEARDVHQQALQDVRVSPQVHPPHPLRLIQALSPPPTRRSRRPYLHPFEEIPCSSVEVERHTKQENNTAAATSITGQISLIASCNVERRSFADESLYSATGVVQKKIAYSLP